MGILKRLVTEEEGAGMVEYGLLVSLIALAAIAGVSALGGHLNTFFSNLKDKLVIPS